MSSVLRSLRTNKLPDQNSSHKWVWTWFYENGSHPETTISDFIIKFSCANGVFELEGDSYGTSAETIINDVGNAFIDYMGAKYLGGLRLVSDFGPNMRQFLGNIIGGDPDSIEVISPGISSTVFINDLRYGDHSNAGIDITPSYYPSGPNRNASTWVVKEPVRFRITGEGTAEFDYVQPIGDDVTYATFPYAADPAFGFAQNRSVEPTTTLPEVKSSKKAEAIIKMFRPVNREAKSMLDKKIKAIITPQ